MVYLYLKQTFLFTRILSDTNRSVERVNSFEQVGN